MPVTRMLTMLAVLASACGPGSENSSPTDGSWLLGVYSLQAPTTTEASDSLVDRYSFEEGGVAEWQKISFERVVNERELSWELQNADDARVYPSPYDEEKDIWYTIRPGEDCDTLALTYIDPNGHELGPAPVFRGAVCTRQPDPEGVPTDFDRYWCDEPPPPCEDP